MKNSKLWQEKYAEVWAMQRPLYGSPFPSPIYQVDLNFDLCKFYHAKQVVCLLMTALQEQFELFQ